MRDQRKNRDLIISLILSSILILLANTSYYYDKLGGLIMPISILIMLVIGLIILGRIIIPIRLIIKYKVLRTRKFIIPLLIYIFALFETFINPFGISFETLHSKIEFRACYEGTVNTAVIKFRENKTFDFNWVGFFAHSDYYRGTWLKKSDTLIMTYKNNKPDRLNDTLFIQEEYFYQMESDSLKQTWFYLGYCKGLN